MADTILHSTTQKFLDIYDITNNMVILKDGTCSLVIQVDAMNFGLLAEEEQDSIMYAYAGLLNSLNYPIQIIVHSQTKDVTGYLQILKEQEEAAESRTQQQRIRRYREFVSNLIRERNVLDKKFYVAISAEPIEVGIIAPTSMIPGQSTAAAISPEQRTAVIEKARNLLEPKRDHLLAQFARIGLFARQLTTQEIIQFFYVSYNPEAAEGQQIADTTNYTTPLVTAGVERVTMNDAQASPTNQPTPAADVAATPTPDATATPKTTASPGYTPTQMPPNNNATAAITPDVTSAANPTPNPVATPTEAVTSPQSPTPTQATMPPSTANSNPETTLPNPTPQMASVPPQLSADQTLTPPPATITPPAPTPDATATPKTTASPGYTPTQMPPNGAPDITPTSTPTPATTEVPASVPQTTSQPTTPTPEAALGASNQTIDNSIVAPESIESIDTPKTNTSKIEKPEKIAQTSTPKTPVPGPTVTSATHTSDLPKPTLPSADVPTSPATPITTPNSTQAELSGAVVDTISPTASTNSTEPAKVQIPTNTPTQPASAKDLGANHTPSKNDDTPKQTDGDNLPPLPEI